MVQETRIYPHGDSMRPLLFKGKYVEPVREGRKTVTRRMKSDAKAGDVCLAYNRPPWVGGKPFAELRILSVRKERVGQCTVADAIREGFVGPKARENFLAAIRGTYGGDEKTECVRIQFEVVKLF